MQRNGIVTSVLIDKNTEKINIDLDNSQTEDSCSIKQKNCYAVKNCATCGGCGFAGKNKETGLFAVSGNKITALNKSGRNLKKGDKVIVEIKENQTRIQALSSVILPIFLAFILSLSFYFFFYTEKAIVGGLFLGLIMGTALAFPLKNKMGDKALPQVIG
ncbi:SoxR reducing system RseC family protein [Treponema sp. OMZ 787]|uniref:SoxR reducing system RseC family protein n=1 Tax=Treponema sp. OMZ 787 TaxID=2563669 RepID=UPI0020A35C11|nr:SoxR reducing system RseC family protein [Treponema sp. OMZ 787]UTC61507.1 SoxR reducing system RseC family protein [Treponema sp. OMZ 787]